MDPWEAPENWDMDEQASWQDFVDENSALGNDDYAMIMFHEAFFDLDLAPPDRDEWHDRLEEYLMEEYGIDFDDVFDWAYYDEWYENAS